MATSGTTDFNLSLNEIFEDAYERCGREIRTARDYRTARRSLNSLLIKWANRGTNFWKVSFEVSTLTEGDATLDLDASVMDVVEAAIRTGTGVDQVDLNVDQFSVQEYHDLSKKNQRGRPTRVWVHKKRDNPVLYFWPTPDQAYSFSFVALKRIEDAGRDARTEADVPWRFLPPLLSGLAYELSAKVAPERAQDLKVRYEEDWREAEAADRQRSDLRVRPDLSAYRR